MEANANKKSLLILGSARENSDTRKLIELLFEPSAIEVLDLLEHSIYHYSYTGNYPPDDTFGQVAERMLAHQLIIFATPVYWYSMSGYMKVLFDRFTDLVTIQKQQGRQLKGKKMLLLAVGTDEQLPAGFEIPFQQTADYLDMHYLGSYHCSTQKLQSASSAAGLANIDKFRRLFKV